MAAIDQPEFKVSLKRTVEHLDFLNTISSDSLQELIFEALNPPDFIYTLAFSYDVSGPDESESGLAVGWTSHNAWVAALALGLVTVLSMVNFYHAYKKQKKAKDNNSHGYVFDQLEKDDNELATQIENYFDNYLKDKSKEQKRQAKNKVVLNSLQELLKEDPELSERYESVNIDENDELVLKTKKLVIKKAFQAKLAEISPHLNWYKRTYAKVKPYIEKFQKSSLNKKFLSPMYQALCIAAITYWGLWIGAGLITGTFDVGIIGVPDALAFGIPSMLSSLFLGMKVKNYYTNRKKKDADESDALNYAGLSGREEYLKRQEQAEQDTLFLLRRFKLNRIFKLKGDFLSVKLRQVETEQERAKEESRLSAEIDARVQGSEILNEQLKYLAEDLGAKSVTTFVSDTASTLVWLQYIAWVSMDFFKKVFNVALNTPGFNLIAGIIVMAVSVLHGAYKAFTTYFERSDQAQKMQQLQEQIAKTGQQKATLEKLYDDKLAEFNSEQEKEKAREGGKPLALSFEPLKFYQDQFFNDINRRGPTDKTKIWKALGRAWTWVTSFTTGVFLAKLFFVAGNAPLLPFAAAALSNPVTAAIVTVCGFLWASFSLYEYIKKRQEARALQTLSQYTERVHCLKQQIKLLDLGIRVLKKQRRAKIVAEVAPELLSGGDAPMRKRGYAVSSEPQSSALFAVKRPAWGLHASAAKNITALKSSF